MQNQLLFAAAAFVVVAGLLLGGGARPGLLSDAILEVACLPVLLIAAWRWLDLPAERRPRSVWLFLLALAALFAVQLIPLPPEMWTKLPQRAQMAEAFALIGRPLPVAAISVDPSLTRASLLATIPPLAVFFAAACLGREERWRLLQLTACFAAASVVLGLLQLAQGPESALRFYRPTNKDDAVGLFANRNHFAALLCSAVVVACVSTAEQLRWGRGARAMLEDRRSFIAALVGATIILTLLCGELMARSRAGIALSFVAVAGALASFYDRVRAGGRGAAKRVQWLGLGAAALGLFFEVPLYRAMERLNSGLLEDARWTIARRAMEATVAHLPTGSGVGSFVHVYATQEKPEEMLPNAYVNHAHDDLLEILLETGLFGAALVVAFALWWGRRSLRAWRPSPGGGDPRLRAAALIVALLLMHSLVDYPLRCAAMTTIFALGCAILAAPDEPLPLYDAPQAQAPSRNRRKGSARSRPVLSPEPPRPVGGNRLAEQEWPKEWNVN